MSSLTAEQTTRSAAYRNRLEPLVRHETHEGLRLQTMIRLRWLAVLGQTIAVLVVGVLLKFPLPLAWCLAVIALSAWLNIFLSVRWRSGVRLAERYSTILLGYDVLQLSALLYLTGGMANPFSFLLIVPVTVSAAALPLERTMLLGMLALGLSAMLTYWRLPLPWPFHQPIELPQLYIFGMWMAVASGISFSALYAWKTASETRAMSKALAETEMIWPASSSFPRSTVWPPLPPMNLARRWRPFTSWRASCGTALPIQTSSTRTSSSCSPSPPAAGRFSPACRAARRDRTKCSRSRSCRSWSRRSSHRCAPERSPLM